MPKLTIIATSESSLDLARHIEGLRKDVGYDFGLDVKKDEKIPGKYELVPHNGEQDLDRQSVRVIGGNIIMGKAAQTIEAMLRARKIKFQRYDGVEINDPNAANPEINLREPQLIYNP